MQFSHYFITNNILGYKTAMGTCECHSKDGKKIIIIINKKALQGDLLSFNSTNSLTVTKHSASVDGDKKHALKFP